MKNLLKLAISLLICGAVLITGCGKTSAPSLPDELKAPNTDYPNTINIIAPEFFAGLSADDTEIKQQWLDEMSQQYGVNLNIISNFYTDSGDFDNSAGEKAQDVLAGNDTTFKGLMRIFGSSMDSSVRVGIEYDTIVPLEDYLADNAVWNSLPESFKSLFEVEGHIYAIPTHNSRRCGISIPPWPKSSTSGKYRRCSCSSRAVRSTRSPSGSPARTILRSIRTSSPYTKPIPTRWATFTNG